MKRIFVTITVLLGLSSASFADHIKGGFFTYQYLGPGANAGDLRFRITLTVYMICEANPQQVNTSINFTIFRTASRQFVRNESVSISNEYNLSKTTDEPCISEDQTGCYYKVVVYNLASIDLPSTPDGYTISYQRCCRINGIQNMIAPSKDIGNTFTIAIPGTSTGLNAHTNSSPVFPVNDTAVVCAGSYFELSFQGADPNTEDSLSYEFCEAFQGGSPDGQNSAPTTAAPPPYATIPYRAPFSGSQPMGANVTINPQTGFISGITPNITGEYVICVCVNEYRQGFLIARSRKELHIRVEDCVPIAVNLAPQYINCDGFSSTFINGGDQSQITSYNWSFDDPASGGNNTSTVANPTHVFSDTGTYTITLTVNQGQVCSKTGTTIMKVYPGFFPGFTNIGVCYLNPVQFIDTTHTDYGTVSSWGWNFGDNTSTADTSHLQNPSWTYSSPGDKTIQLIAGNSKGCIDTITKTVTLIDRPPIALAFKDTLICVPDALQLQASGTGNFSWTPPFNIINANTATPTVNPNITTTYIVQLDDQGCINTDSVKVRVVDFVTLNEMPDTIICRTDNVQLHVSSDGLHYQWTPVAAVNDPTLQNPIGISGNTTTYTVTAIIGSCSATKNILVTAYPYPVVNAGPDTTICYNTPAFLHGMHNADTFSWSPAASLLNANTLNPTAYPARTTPYVLSAQFTSANTCPKPATDTVIVTVLPKIIPFAGRDTMVVVGQPLQLNAEGGVSYVWTPSTGLNNPNIKNPIGIYSAELDSVRYIVRVFNDAGCYDSASVKVTIFKTVPSVFVPTAFTPNGDGLNDLIRPIAVGVAKINYFSIYNRWGQLVFRTTINGHGWDGRINGAPQGSGVFVWMVSAVDYLGKPIFMKGTVTLIR